MAAGNLYHVERRSRVRPTWTRHTAKPVRLALALAIRNEAQDGLHGVEFRVVMADPPPFDNRSTPTFWSR